MKKSELRHIIRKIIQEQDKKEKTNQKIPSNDKPVNRVPIPPRINKKPDGYEPDDNKLDPFKGPPRRGCTDPDALNYYEYAEIDDGSCEYPEGFFGCTDPNAINFSPEAEEDDGSCVEGCCEELDEIIETLDINMNYYNALRVSAEEMGSIVVDTWGLIDEGENGTQICDSSTLQYYNGVYFGTAMGGFDVGESLTDLCNEGYDFPILNPQNPFLVLSIGTQGVIFGNFYVVPPKYKASNIKVIFKGGFESEFTSQGWVYPELSSFNIPGQSADAEGYYVDGGTASIFGELGALNQHFTDLEGVPTNPALQLAPNSSTNSINQYNGSIPGDGNDVGGVHCFNFPLYCLSLYNQLLKNVYEYYPQLNSGELADSQFEFTDNYYFETYLPFYYDALGAGPNTSGCCQNTNQNARTAPDPIDPPTIPPPFSAGEGYTMDGEAFQDIIDMSNTNNWEGPSPSP